MLPAHLRQLGYQTAAVGKWHLGMFAPDVLPTGRGFDSFFGYYGGAEDYFTHKVGNWVDLHDDTADGIAPAVGYEGKYSTHFYTQRACDIIHTFAARHVQTVVEESAPPSADTPVAALGSCGNLHNNSGTDAHKYASEVAASYSVCCELCAADAPCGHFVWEPAIEKGCHLKKGTLAHAGLNNNTGYVAGEAVAPPRPPVPPPPPRPPITSLFLYLAYQAIHSPDEVPDSYKERFRASIPDTADGVGQHRRTVAGMVSALDEGIGNVTRALQAAGMAQQTIIVFTTDNGGPAQGFNSTCCCDNCFLFSLVENCLVIRTL
jgi:arylsulfatase A-like enzyme